MAQSHQHKRQAGQEAVAVALALPTTAVTFGVATLISAAVGAATLGLFNAVLAFLILSTMIVGVRAFAAFSAADAALVGMVAVNSTVMPRRDLIFEVTELSSSHFLATSS